MVDETNKEIEEYLTKSKTLKVGECTDFENGEKKIKVCRIADKEDGFEIFERMKREDKKQ
jgi:Mg/Co/Ni transporter MgtE